MAKIKTTYILLAYQ